MPYQDTNQKTLLKERDSPPGLRCGRHAPPSDRVSPDLDLPVFLGGRKGQNTFSILKGVSAYDLLAPRLLGIKGLLAECSFRGFFQDLDLSTQVSRYHREKVVFGMEGINRGNG